MTDRPSAFALLSPLAARGMVLDLGAMRSALGALGDPHLSIPAVHIAGTNGKGSVAAMVARPLRIQGHRVGLYTSPHLHRFEERIVVDGEPVDASKAACAAESLLREMTTGALPPLTFFEAATLLAWRLFTDAGVEVAVLEVGLGGRLDATTLCAPAVCAITRIALDHTAILGPDLASIAREKAGILKAGVPCVIGPDLDRDASSSARAVILEAASRLGSTVIHAGQQSNAAVGGVPWLGSEGGVLTLAPSLHGGHQIENAATAAALLGALDARGVATSRRSAELGIREAAWPGRCERIDDVFLDCAHNPDGVYALLRALPSMLDGRRLGALVFGASTDKDHGTMLRALGEIVPAGRVFMVAARMARAEDPVVLAGRYGGIPCSSPSVGLRRAREAAAGGVVLVCGSIFLVAEVRAELLGIDNEPLVGL